MFEREAAEVPETYLSPEQISERIGIPVPSIHDWWRKGRGPARIKVGRHVRVAESELNRWLDSRTIHPSVER